jgi:hypothetical protein
VFQTRRKASIDRSLAALSEVIAKKLAVGRELHQPAMRAR